MTNPISLSEFTTDDRGASELSRYLELSEYIKNLTAEKDAIAQRLKIELGNNPDPIIDGEHGLVATLVPRSKPAQVDLGTLAKDDPRAGEFLAEAARAGVLNAVLTPLRALKGKSEWADKLLAREMPMGVDYTLRVEKA